MLAHVGGSCHMADTAGLRMLYSLHIDAQAFVIQEELHMVSCLVCIDHTSSGFRFLTAKYKSFISINYTLDH